MSTRAMKDQKMEAFGSRLMTILNESAVALMISMGHRTGLFDTMAAMKPSTSEEIARQADLDERYVREWLGAMVTGRIVDYNPRSKTFKLPREHAAFLTRDAAPNNVAAFAQYIPIMGSVEDKIFHCFQNGGGVPYSEYPRFHEVMAEDSGQSVVPAIFDHILPLAPELPDALKRGINVLDIGCGRGRAIVLMAKEFPESRFTGYDISQEAISFGTIEARQRGLSNLQFEVVDVSQMNESEEFDLITAFDAIHDQARPDVVLRNVCNALKQDGTFLMQDIAGSSFLENNMDHPMGSFLYTVSTMHCMTVSLSADGMGLGTMWGEELANQMLREAGFATIERHKLDHDPQNYYYIVRK